MRGMLTRLVEGVAAWWKDVPNRTIAKYAKAIGLPWPSSWRLVPYFLLLVLLFLLFPLFLLIARIIIRRAEKRAARAREATDVHDLAERSRPAPRPQSAHRSASTPSDSSRPGPR